MQYKLIKNGQEAVLRMNDDGTISSVPSDWANRDWQDYQNWLAEDNTPLADSDDWE